MRAGKLDRTITIERSTEVLDAYGVPSSTWSTIATLRAELIDATTTETVRDRGASTEARLSFRTRYVDGVTVADCLTYAGSAFNIVALKEIGRRRSLEITVERIGP